MWLFLSRAKRSFFRSVVCVVGSLFFLCFFAIANTLGCSAWFFLKSCGPWLSCVGFAAKHCFRSQLGGDVGFHARER